MIIAQLLIMHVIGAIRFSHGPAGFVWYVQPPHVAAGFGFVRDRFVWWWQTQ